MEKFRILMIEDDFDMMSLIRIYLEPDYEVVSAYNGLDALVKVPLAEPDLVIADIMMPIMNGWEFITRLRRDPKFAEIPVIFLSALGSRGDIMEGYRAGADLYLTKPIEPERLVRNLKVTIEKQKLVARPKTYPIAELLKKDAFVKPVSKGTFAQPEHDSPSSSPSPDSHPVSPKKKSQDRLRLLVVDDDPDTITMLKFALSEEFEFLSARDGLQAMEITARFKPDVFVIDWLMPKMSGYQFCQSIKRTDDFSLSPVIFISAKSTRKDRELIDRLGVYQFVAKPFKPADIERILEGIAQRPDFAPRSDRPLYSEYLADLESRDPEKENPGDRRVSWMD